MGGIGKTELAVQYATRHKDNYSGGLCWLQCRAGDVGTQIVNFALSRLGLTIPEVVEPPDRIGYCWQHWKEGQVLLIYDDVTDYQEIAPLLPPRDMSRFKVLMTSRIQPNPITGIRGIDLPVLDENPALELLRSLVGDGEKPPEQNRIDREIDIAKGLCEWLGYLPLGLELVGGYLAQSEDMSLKELWEELNDDRLEAEALQSIEGELKTPLGLVKAFLLSWESLGVEAKKLGCQLSLFASADILWEWVEKLFPQEQSKNVRKVRDKELLKFSLLQKTGEKKYKLHSLIRKFFITKQDEIENIDDCKRDICRVMVAIATEIPSTVTLEVIESTTAYIPHLREVGESLTKWVEDEVLTWPFTVLGIIYEGQSQFTEAEKWYKKSVKVTRHRLGERHPHVAASYNNLANLYREMGRYEEALPLSQNALEIRLEQLGERHPDVAQSYNNLAALYSSMGRYEEALPLDQKALEIRLEQLGERHPDVATSYNNLAGLYDSMGRYKEALPLYQKALEIRLEQLGERNPDVAISYNNLAGLYRVMGRYEEAIAHYQQAVNIAQQTLGENHPNTLTFTNNYLQMLLEAPTEEILKALPEEMHENYLQWRSDWEKQKE
jgi:tetratricopeptide (TPR) repeat protein